METKERRRRCTNPLQPARIQFGHAGGGQWAALIVDRHGAGIEFITGTRPEVLLAVRQRWPGLPIDHLAFAIETETTNGHRLNPAGAPVRVVLGRRGEGQWLGVVVDARGVALEVIVGTRAAVLAAIHRRWPGRPLEFLPLRNPAVRIEWTGAGAGHYLAVVVDERNQVAAEFWGTLPEVEAWMRREWPKLPATFVPMIRNPRSREQASRKEGAVSDRALRYRANADPPPGDRICALCGSTRTIEVGHINGREDDHAPANLLWTCRSCNVLCANTLRRAGLGRLTHQYNPGAENQGARTLGQWLTAVMSMKGESTTMPVATAVDMIRATDPEQRSQFARQIWRRRREHFGPAGRPAATPF